MATVGVIGVGSIGGSVLLAAQRAGWQGIGYDSDPASSDCGSAQDVYDRADVVVVAVHLDATLATLRALQAHPPKASLILDVASVKAPVVAAVTGLAHFVATHPMAGTERSGRTAARADLFDGRSWAYVPSGDTALDDRVRAFIRLCGAEPVATDAVLHDRIVALTSHAPQVVASTISGRILDLARTHGPAVDALCGPVARELLRVGRSDIGMWRALLQANAGEVVTHLRAIASELETVARGLEEGDRTVLERIFVGARPR